LRVHGGKDFREPYGSKNFGNKAPGGPASPLAPIFAAAKLDSSPSIRASGPTIPKKKGIFPSAEKLIRGRAVRDQVRRQSGSVLKGEKKGGGGGRGTVWA